MITVLPLDSVIKNERIDRLVYFRNVGKYPIKHDSLCDGNTNIYPSRHHLRDIRNRNVRDLHLTFRMGQGQSKGHT